jgi:hypothetical protein
MASIIAICFGFMALGAAMAIQGVPWPIRPGYIGAALIVGAAWLGKRHWQKRRLTVGDDPSASERITWLKMGGTALICGFVLVVLSTPGSEVHRTTGDTGGFDTWIMLGGAAIAWFIVRESNSALDERDHAFDATAQKVGYTALTVLLLIFLLALGFAPKPMMKRFTHWLIANSLLTLIMLAALAQYVAQLICYWRDAKKIAALSASGEDAQLEKR